MKLEENIFKVIESAITEVLVKEKNYDKSYEWIKKQLKESITLNYDSTFDGVDIKYLIVGCAENSEGFVYTIMELVTYSCTIYLKEDDSYKIDIEQIVPDENKKLYATTRKVILERKRKVSLEDIIGDTIDDDTDEIIIGPWSIYINRGVNREVINFEERKDIELENQYFGFKEIDIHNLTVIAELI